VKGSPWHDEPVTSRFLTLADVAETLNVSASQVYALVRSGELRAIKVGGRGQWRVESSALEEWISQSYVRTEEFVRTHPLTDAQETVELD
jgi:excisionase family DNA binding protein